jgi:secreted trypsin-like serine protease
VACADVPDAAQVQRPIFGGTPDLNPDHLAVVALVQETGFGDWAEFCTGTLITRTVVLTAAHCLDDTDTGDYRVFFGNDATRSGDLVTVLQHVQHPGWDGSAPESGDDVALIRLAGPAPAGVKPIPHLPAAKGLDDSDVGTDLEFSGFGLTESGSSDEKLHVLVALDAVCPGPDPCTDEGVEISPRAFGYTQEAGGPCFGDSGGPAFIVRDGYEYVAGITSYGDDCEGYGVSTAVHPYQAWIEDWSFIGGTEVCDLSGDEDGDGLADCDDPDCGDHACCTGGPCVMRQPPGGCGQAGDGRGAALLLVAVALALGRRRWP